MLKIGDNIRKLRENRKMTKVELAERLDLKSYSTISKWEIGENHPRAKEIRMLCELFNVSADYLLGLSESADEIKSRYYKYYPVSIAAGIMSHVEGINQEIVQKVAIPDSVMGKYAGNSDVFLMNTSGTSMNKIFPSGSLIALKPMQTIYDLKDGDIVVFSVNNEYSIKRYFNDIENKRIIFRPESTDNYHVDIVFNYDSIEELNIHGKLVASITSLLN